MSNREKRARRERSTVENVPRTRFDNRRRNLIIAGVAVLLLLALAIPIFSGSEAFSTDSSSGTRRNQNVFPRNTDIWYVYPDNSVRFVTLFYPTFDADSGPTVVSAAGPLINAEEDVVEDTPIGGELISRELLPRPDEATEQLYHLYTIDHTPKRGQPYGVDVTALNSPYVTPLLDEDIHAAIFGAGPQEAFRQVIVVVALPLESEIISFRDLQPYQEKQIGDWQLYYFDTTSLITSGLIYIEYVPGTEVPKDLAPARVDRAR